MTASFGFSRASSSDAPCVLAPGSASTKARYPSGNNALGRQFCRVRQYGGHVFSLQSRMEVHDLVGGSAGHQIVEHHGCHDAGALDASLAVADRPIDADACSPVRALSRADSHGRATAGSPIPVDA